MSAQSCYKSNIGQGVIDAFALDDLRVGLSQTRAVSNPSLRARGWYLREWLLAKNKRQADVIRDLGWERGRVSKLATGKQPYAREDVNALAEWLGIEPYELLMQPREARSLRDLREAASWIAQGHAVAESAPKAGFAEAPAVVMEKLRSEKRGPQR